LFPEVFGVGFFVFHGLGPKEVDSSQPKKGQRFNTPTGSGQAPSTEAGAQKHREERKKQIPRCARDDSTENAEGTEEVTEKKIGAPAAAGPPFRDALKRP
jgi:hypothetical protein